MSIFDLHFFDNENLARELSDKFDKKYKIDDKSIKSMSRQKNNVFNPAFKSIEDTLFPSNFKIIPTIGGLLFTQEDFHVFINCLKLIDEKQYYIIEDSHENQLAYHFSTDVDWTELINGGYPAYELLRRPIRNYFVFGLNPIWARYVGNDLEFPLDIYGIHQDYVVEWAHCMETIISNSKIDIDRLPPSIKSFLF